jgi:hypothetical protein
MVAPCFDAMHARITSIVITRRIGTDFIKASTSSGAGIAQCSLTPLQRGLPAHWHYLRQVFVVRKLLAPGLLLWHTAQMQTEANKNGVIAKP